MKFTLKITESEIYLVEDIEAETEMEAFEKALEIMDQKGKEQFHSDSDGDYEVQEQQSPCGGIGAQMKTKKTKEELAKIEKLWHKATHSYHNGNYAGKKTSPSKYRRQSV